MNEVGTHQANRVEYYYTEAAGIEVILTKGQEHDYPWHMHTQHWTIGVICQGTACLTTENSSQWLSQSQHFLIPPYVPHSLCVEPKSSLFVTCFDEQGALLLKNSPEILLSCGSCLELGSSCFELKGIREIEKNIAISNQHDFLYGFYEKHLTAPNAFFRRQLREIICLILAKPDEPLSIEQMAAHANYSQWHFLRVFQKMMGMTPHAFQLLCRLRLLRSLLREDTAASIAAVSAGFTDQSHMHKVFKYHHGMTPGAFRKASVRLEL